MREHPPNEREQRIAGRMADAKRVTRGRELSGVDKINARRERLEIEDERNGRDRDRRVNRTREKPVEHGTFGTAGILIVIPANVERRIPINIVARAVAEHRVG